MSAPKTPAAKAPAAKGTHGGRRPGAGRKRGVIDRELRRRLGYVDLDDPLGQARWYQRAIALLTDGILDGQPYRKMLETVRASATAAAKILPLDVIYEASKRLDRDERELREAEADADVVERSRDRVAKRTGPIRRDPT